jgi:hypothetical protein
MASLPCAADDARVFVTSLTFRTADSRYAWLNTVFGVLEGVLDTVVTGGTRPPLRPDHCQLHP